MIPLVAPTFFDKLPHGLDPFLHSGILLTAVVSVALNLYFNGMQSAENARLAAAQSSHGSE